MSFHLLNKMDDISKREKGFITWTHRFYYALCVVLLVFAGILPAIAFFVVGGIVMAVYWIRQAMKEVEADNERLNRRDKP